MNLQASSFILNCKYVRVLPGCFRMLSPWPFLSRIAPLLLMPRLFSSAFVFHSWEGPNPPVFN